MGKSEKKQKSEQVTDATEQVEVPVTPKSDKKEKKEKKDKSEKKEKEKSEESSKKRKHEEEDTVKPKKEKKKESPVVDLVEGPLLISPLASPLASESLQQRLFALVPVAREQKRLKRGVKEVTKALRKQAKGIVLMAGDVAPVDVMSHLPILCEEQNLAYVYVSSKVALGASTGSRRPTSVLLVGATGDKEFKELEKEIKELVKEYLLR